MAGTRAEQLRTWEAWRLIHQPFELQWWKKRLAENPLTDDGFNNYWNGVKDFIKPSGAILDIGCGPRPAFAPCTVIEPLAHSYRSIVPGDWWKDITVYSQPAEYRIDSLRENFDTVICWNCIDHAVGWRAILENMRAYGNDRARYIISTDFWPPFTGHPGFERDDFMKEISKHFRVIEFQDALFGRTVTLIMEGWN